MRKLISMIIMMVLFSGGLYLYERVACGQRAVSFVDYKFGFFSGCMVQHNGRWLPIDNIRGFDDKG